jgi:hypothetical protein
MDWNMETPTQFEMGNPGSIWESMRFNLNGSSLSRQARHPFRKQVCVSIRKIHSRKGNGFGMGE